MPQPNHVSAVGVPDAASLDEDIQAVFAKCTEKLGLIPNVLAAYSLRPNKLRNFMAMYNELMLAPSGLSKLEREMVAVVVSSANHCYYCLVAHGQAVRALSGDPQLGEMMVMNYRVAPLDKRQRAMLDFAWKLTKTPEQVVEADRAALADVGLSHEDIFDLADTVGFFNMSNRMAIGIDMIPNPEYHGMDRPAAFTPPPKKAKSV
ncbi:peroxidase-related enzyme [Alcaligenaceae bacterium]|nr:peroxidase-related enzyme [Alcaligenaceae bacterium]